MPPWLSILTLQLAGGVSDHSRVMRTQRDELDNLQTGGILGDAAEVAVGPDGSLNITLESLQCSDMPLGFCCGLSPKKIRIDKGSDNCACSGPDQGGKFATQESIDAYCNEVIQPCKQLSHVVCCGQSPKMIRHHDGNDQCWCSGPKANSSYSSQSDIDDWCASVIKPCASLSEGHCCHLHPKQIRQGAGDKCWCSDPTLGTRFPSQAHIDQACSKVVKSCKKLSREDCCSLSPKQIRYNDGNDGCWCSAPVVGETYSTQILVDNWCSRVAAQGSTTTALPTTTSTTTALSTLKVLDFSCDEVSEEMCCGKKPKMFLEHRADRCFCAGVNSSKLTQKAIDAKCATVVQPCSSLRQEDCCQRSPRRYLVGDQDGVQTAVGKTEMCACAGPMKASRYTEQQAIDKACFRLFKPCSQLSEANCCLSTPAQMRQGSGEHCFCSGPSSDVTQQDIDKKCRSIVRPCSELTAAACCSKGQVRVTDGFQRCWCSGPFLNGNVSYSQQMLNAACSLATPQTIQLA